MGRPPTHAPQCVAKVEGDLDTGCSQHLATFGVADQEKLLGRGHGEKTGRTDDHQHDGGDRVLCQKEDGQKRQTHDALRGSGDFAGAVSVGETAACQIAGEHAETGQHHEKRHLRWLEARDGGHEWIDVAEPAECATVAQCRGKEDEPGNGGFEETELARQSRCRGVPVWPVSSARADKRGQGTRERLARK